MGCIATLRSRVGGAVVAASLATGCFEAELDNFGPRADASAGSDEPTSAVGSNSSGSGGTSGVGSSVDELLVDDFEDGDTLASNGFGWWYSLNDTAGDQDFRVSYVSDRAGSTRAANSSGIGFDIWGALVGLDLTEDSGTFDGSAFTELRFWARAAPDSVSTISARLLEPDEVQFGQSLELGTEWQEYVLRFDELKNVDGSEGPLDTTRLAAFQIFVFSDQRFNFWIDDVVFVANP